MTTVFRFASPEVFQLLWLVPVVLFLAWFMTRNQKRRIANAFGSRLSPFLTSSLSMARRYWKLVFEVLAIVLMITALGRPQFGKSDKKIKSEGVEYVLLFDVSNSMMAEDVKPSRLDLAKKEITRFLDFGGGDRIGLVAFAGSSALMSPLTTDKSALKMFIDSLSPDSVSTQGTNFSKALTSALEAFKRGGVEEDQDSVVTKAIIIVSDGEDNEAGALDAAKEIHNEHKISIFSLAIGSEKGGAIPIRDQRGNLRGYRKNSAGQVILTKTEGTILKELARIGGGSFYHVTYGGNSMKNLRRDLDKLQKTTFDSSVATNYDEKYQVLLLFAILFAMFELLLSDRRPLGRIWKGRYEVSEQ